MISRRKTAILLDRDGTINRNYESGPVYRTDMFELLPGAAKAIRVLNDHNLIVAVVTNQGGINHTGRDFSWETYREIEKLMIDKLNDEAGALVDDIFVCHHASYEKCDCRKPAPGLLKQAWEKYNYEPAQSYIIGDSEADILAGKNFGVKTILVESGWDKAVLKKLEAKGVEPDHVFADLAEAVEFIIRELS